ncbi:MAG: helix-turn-helix domain-containing protein [Myxococcota bacterium]
MHQATQEDRYQMVTDALARRQGAKARALADELGEDLSEVRGALIDLEQHGIVYRTGKTRGTTWWLG